MPAGRTTIVRPSDDRPTVQALQHTADLSRKKKRAPLYSALAAAGGLALLLVLGNYGGLFHVLVSAQKVWVLLAIFTAVLAVSFRSSAAARRGASDWQSSILLIAVVGAVGGFVYGASDEQDSISAYTGCELGAVLSIIALLSFRGIEGGWRIWVQNAERRARSEYGETDSPPSRDAAVGRTPSAGGSGSATRQHSRTMETTRARDDRDDYGNERDRADWTRSSLTASSRFDAGGREGELQRKMKKRASQRTQMGGTFGRSGGASMGRGGEYSAVRASGGGRMTRRIETPVASRSAATAFTPAATRGGGGTRTTTSPRLRRSGGGGFSASPGSATRRGAPGSATKHGGMGFGRSTRLGAATQMTLGQSRRTNHHHLGGGSTRGGDGADSVYSRHHGGGRRGSGTSFGRARSHSGDARDLDYAPIGRSRDAGREIVINRARVLMAKMLVYHAGEWEKAELVRHHRPVPPNIETLQEQRLSEICKRLKDHDAAEEAHRTPDDHELVRMLTSALDHCRTRLRLWLRNCLVETMDGLEKKHDQLTDPLGDWQLDPDMLKYRARDQDVTVFDKRQESKRTVQGRQQQQQRDHPMRVMFGMGRISVDLLVSLAAEGSSLMHKPRRGAYTAGGVGYHKPLLIADARPATAVKNGGPVFFFDDADQRSASADPQVRQMLVNKMAQRTQRTLRHYFGSDGIGSFEQYLDIEITPTLVVHESASSGAGGWSAAPSLLSYAPSSVATNAGGRQDWASGGVAPNVEKKQLRSVPIEGNAAVNHFRAPGLLSKAYTLERLSQMARGRGDEGIDFDFEARNAEALIEVLGDQSNLSYAELARWCAPRTGNVLPVPLDADIVVNLFFSVLNDRTPLPPREVRRRHFFDGDVAMLETEEKRRSAGIAEMWPKIVRTRDAEPSFEVWHVKSASHSPHALKAAPGIHNVVDTILLFLDATAKDNEGIGGKANLMDFKCTIESEDARLVLEVPSLAHVLQEPRLLQLLQGGY